MKQILFFAIFCLSISLTQAQQSTQRTLSHDNVNRIYRIYVPQSYTGNKAVPLVMAFHGLGDNAANFQGIGFNQLANQDTFIVIYPQALPDQLFQANAWNAGVGGTFAGFTYFLNADVDDIGFVNSLIDTLSSEFNLDSNRIYSTGFSLGAYMTQRLACEMSDRIAAIGTVSGLIGNNVNCSPDGAMPVLHFHGTADSTITYTGEFPSPVGKGEVGLSVDEMISNWTDKNTCTEPMEYDPIPDAANDGRTVERFTYPDCDSESEVVFYKITNGTHEWPYTPNNDIDATELIWEFFQKHSNKKEDNTVGIAANLSKANIQVYPNPATTQLFVKTSELVQRISLYNVIGQNVKNIEQPALQNRISLDGIPAGVYLLTVQENEKVYSYKVMKR